jgi:hypothetical protein
MKTARLWILALLLAFAPAVPGACCSVPVFRYALDHWQADMFRLELSTRDAADAGVARFARNLGANSGLNLDIHRLPENKTDSESRLVRPALGPAEPVPLWSGTASARVIEQFTDSAGRREIADRILKGHSAVWVLAEGPDPQANNAAAALVEKRLRYLEQVVRLPEIDPNDPDSKVGPGPALKVEFSLLRLPHSAEEEAPLRAMLAGPRSGLDRSGQAWIATVFGRGRVLGAWPAAELDDAAIEEVALFLVGACSCQVKRQNPGWDLLLHLDWDEKLAALGIPALPGPSDKGSPGNNTEPKASGETPPVSAESSPAAAPAGSQGQSSKPEVVSFRVPEPGKPAQKKREGIPIPAILVGLTLVFMFAGWYRKSL